MRTAGLRADPRRQGPSRVAGLHVREGAAPRPLPERPAPADLTRCGGAPDGTFEEIDWDTAIAEVAGRLRRGARHPRRGVDLLLRGRRAGEPPRAAPTRRRHAPALGVALPVQRAGPGEDRRVLGQRPDARHPRPRRLRATPRSALFVGKNPWQSPRHPPRPHHAEGDRPRPRPVDDRDRPAPHRDGRAGRLPPPGPARHRRLVPRRAGRGARRGGPARPDWLADARRPASTRSPPHLAKVDVAGLLPRSPASTRTSCARPPAASRGRERASPCSRTSACRCPCTPRCRATSRSCSGCSPATSARPGAQYVPHEPREPRRAAAYAAAGRRAPARWPAPASSPAWCPANVIAEEILTDHPARYRAMLVESGNPAHSLADSQRMREALGVARLLVVIDVAMTETARLADYVLPAPTQFEKWEATFFNFDFPRNVFHLRRPLLDPLPGGPLRRAGDPRPAVRGARRLRPTTTRPAAGRGRGSRAAFAAAFFAAMAAEPALGRLAPVVALPHARPDAARRRRRGRRAVGRRPPVRAGDHPDAVRRGRLHRGRPRARRALFDAILASPSGLVFTVDEPEDGLAPDRDRRRQGPPRHPRAARRARRPAPAEPSPGRPDFPFVLSAGERRSFTANTIFRDPAWRKRDAGGSLRISPSDAAGLGLDDGDLVRVTTTRGQRRGGGRAVTDHAARPRLAAQRPRARLPGGGRRRRLTGAAPNELTARDDRDRFAGTPWHKHVPARVEAV